MGDIDENEYLGPVNNKESYQDIKLRDVQYKLNTKIFLHEINIVENDLILQ